MLNIFLRFNTSLIFISALFYLNPTPCLAKSNPESLDDMVVTANRRESTLRTAPAMVTVISGEELTQASEITVDDYLKRISSVSHSRTHIAECGPGRDITLRGIQDQKRTLVLVDGIPFNDGQGGSVNWSIIPKEMVDRIEIVRGPMSALYGSGAMGGVINIITKKPDIVDGTTISGSYGSLNTFTTSIFNAGMINNDSGYLLGGKLYQTDGYVQAIEKESYYVENERKDISLIGKYQTAINDGSILSFGINYADEDYSRGILLTDQINRTLLLTASYESWLKDGVDFSVSGYINSLDREVILSARPTYDNHDHTEKDKAIKYGQLFQLNNEIEENHLLSVGFDSSITKMDKENVYVADRDANAEGTQILLSLFIQDEISFIQGKHKLIFTPGFRVDYSKSSDGKSVDTNPGMGRAAVDIEYEDRSWSAFNPKLSLVDNIGNSTTIRASVGKSFAAPTLFSLYTVFSRGPSLLYGNPELDPEEAWSAEVGIDHYFSKNVLLRAAAYHTKSKNFIGYRSLSAFESQADNITGVKVSGIDFELHWKISSNWKLHSAYTNNRSTVAEDDTDSDIVGNYLPFVPKQKANIGVNVKVFDGILIDLNARYEGDRYDDYDNDESAVKDEYVSLDLALSGKINSNVVWTLTFENLLDENYDIYSVPPIPAEAPGLLVNASMSYKL